MTNTAALVLYIPIVLVTITVIVIAFRRDRERPVIRSFLFLGIVAIGWEIAAMLYFASWTVPMATYLYDAKLPFVAFAALAFLLFVLHFYRLDQYARPQLIVLLSIIPLITAVLSLTTPWHDLMRTRLEVVSLWPRQIVVCESGIWYWVHALYSYLLVAVSAVVVISQHIKLPKTNRLPSMLLIGGAGFTVFCNILALANVVSYPFNLTPISTGVSAILFYLALCNCSQMDFLMLARNEIFHFMDDAVFVLDAKGKILDINRSGKSWLAELGVPLPVGSFNDIIRFLEESGAKFRYAVEHDPGVDVTVTPNHKTAVYNIREKRIVGDDGYEMGMYVTCTDVTRNRLLINRLEETAEVDALTGLQNRWGLYRMAERIQEENRMPVTMILGDVNGLKAINDNYGHQKGDELLREIARVLKEVCPPQGQPFRVGGDEFILLLPACDEHRAQEIVGEIHSQLYCMQTLPFRISISLGIACEHCAPFSLDQLMNRADKHMYQQKNRTSTNA